MIRILLLLITINCNAQLRKDYQDHFVVGTFLGFAGYSLTMDKTPILYGIGTGVVVGGLKEIYDIKHGTPEWQDFGYTVLGAAVSSLILHTIIKSKTFTYGNTYVDRDYHLHRMLYFSERHGQERTIR
jgi:hypothetical protein